uniref:FTH domain-containing protein n=1 Tax=Panagrolaimus superbus TaxID=310955 RepID=A0A914YJX2_9BILA
MVLRGNVLVVVTVEKLSQKNGILSLYSAETSVEPFTWELSRRKPWFKIHVNDEFEIGSSQFLTTTLRYIHSAKLTKLDLNYHSIDFGDFKKLVSSYTIKTFIGGPVYRINVDGEKVNLRLDEILKELPNIETCEIYQGDMSSNAVEYKKLTKLPRFMKLQKFTFRDLSSLFNVLNFTGFIKTNPNVSFVLKYNYVSRIQKNNIRTREKQLRESLPSNCNVVVEY